MARSKSIKLTSIKKVRSPNSKYNYVTFFISPEISENRSVTYVEISDVRLPSSILIWMGSPSRNFSLNAKFLARSEQEANVAFRNLNILKSWCVTKSPLDSSNTVTRSNVNDILKTVTVESRDPSNSVEIDTQGDESVTASETSKSFTADSIFQDTPEVLLLEGYGGQFRSIPVVITSLNITFPSDVDYIQNSKKVWVPILHEVSISLKEAREISGGTQLDDGSSLDASISSFNLQKFKEGTLEYW